MQPEPPCGCGSVLIHKPTCPLAHPEIAALPDVPLPEGVRLYSDLPGQVSLRVDDWENCLSPVQARSLARMLLLKAAEVERAA